MQKNIIFFKQLFPVYFWHHPVFLRLFEFKNLKKEPDDAKNKGEIIVEKNQCFSALQNKVSLFVCLILCILNTNNTNYII